MKHTNQLSLQDLKLGKWAASYYLYHPKLTSKTDISLYLVYHYFAALAAAHTPPSTSSLQVRQLKREKD
jgi:hypothetical protein